MSDETIIELARVRAELEEERDVARRRAAVAEREVVRLRGLLREVTDAWHTEAMQGDGIDEAHFGTYQRAYAASRGES